MLIVKRATPSCVSQLMVGHYSISVHYTSLGYLCTCKIQCWNQLNTLWIMKFLNHFPEQNLCQIVFNLSKLTICVYTNIIKHTLRYETYNTDSSWTCSAFEILLTGNYKNYKFMFFLIWVHTVVFNCRIIHTMALITQMNLIMMHSDELISQIFRMNNE